MNIAPNVKLNKSNMTTIIFGEIALDFATSFETNLM